MATRVYCWTFPPVQDLLIAAKATRFTPEQVDAAWEACGLTVGGSDILLIRTGDMATQPARFGCVLSR